VDHPDERGPVDAELFRFGQRVGELRAPLVEELRQQRRDRHRIRRPHARIVAPPSSPRRALLLSLGVLYAVRCLGNELEPLIGDGLAAIDAPAVVAPLDPRERVVDQPESSFEHRQTRDVELPRLRLARDVGGMLVSESDVAAAVALRHREPLADTAGRGRQVCALALKSFAHRADVHQTLHAPKWRCAAHGCQQAAFRFPPSRRARAGRVGCRTHRRLAAHPARSARSAPRRDPARPRRRRGVPERQPQRPGGERLARPRLSGREPRWRSHRLDAGRAAPRRLERRPRAGDLTPAVSTTEVGERPYHDRKWLADHLGEERREADLLSEVREAIFGAQAGVTSILIRVTTVAAELAHKPNVLLKTMVEKELGLTFEEGGSALQGALILSAAFAVAALVPIAPFFFLPVRVALVVAVSLSAVVMFALGLAKSRLTGRNPIRSGLEIVLLVLAATAGGWIFGTILPQALGLAGIGS